MSSVRVAECETAADVWRLARESEARRKEWTKPKQHPKPPPPPPPKDPTPKIVHRRDVGGLELWMGRSSEQIEREIRAIANGEENVDELSSREIMRAAARVYGFRTTDLKAARRDAPAAHARQVSMLLCRMLLPPRLRTLPFIGRMHGGRDHTTVLFAVRKLSSEPLCLDQKLEALHTLADPPSAWAASAARLHPLPAMARTYIRREETEAS